VASARGEVFLILGITHDDADPRVRLSVPRDDVKKIRAAVNVRLLPHQET